MPKGRKRSVWKYNYANFNLAIAWSVFAFLLKIVSCFANNCLRAYIVSTIYLFITTDRWDPALPRKNVLAKDLPPGEQSKIL
jgi:hypothetical protein